MGHQLPRFHIEAAVLADLPGVMAVLTESQAARRARFEIEDVGHAGAQSEVPAIVAQRRAGGQQACPATAPGQVRIGRALKSPRVLPK